MARDAFAGQSGEVRHLFAVDDAEQAARDLRTGAAPHVVIVPVELQASPASGEFAFELARALAAQTARSGAVVVADRSTLPRQQRGLSHMLSARRPSALSPLSAAQVRPVSERDGVQFFAAEQAASVIAAACGLMPIVSIATDRGVAAGWHSDASAFVVMSAASARAEYLELLRGELAAVQRVPVLTAAVELPTGGRRRRVEAMRSQAWALAAEVVVGL